MKLIAAFCLSFFTAIISCTAQPYFDIINADCYLLKSPNTGEQPNKPNTTWLPVSVKLPVKLKKDLLIVNPYFENYNIEAINLYGIALQTAYVRQWKQENWKTLFSFIPRISSDLKNLSRDDYQFGGVVLAMYRKNEKLTYKFGAYYNSEYFGFFMIPLLGIDWRINSKLNLFGILPRSMNFEYKVSKLVSTGLVIKSIINSYRLSNSDYFRIEYGLLNIYADFYITQNIVFNIAGGYSFRKKYSVGSKQVALDVNLQHSDGVVLKAGLACRLWPEATH